MANKTNKTNHKRLDREFRRAIVDTNNRHKIDEDDLCGIIHNAVDMEEGVVFGSTVEGAMITRTDEEALEIFNNASGDEVDAFLSPIYNFKNVKILKTVLQDLGAGYKIEKEAVQLLLKRVKENKEK